MRRHALALALLVLAGCGGGDEQVTVYAAASLTDVFQELAPDARFNFAGSDELAAQIREGARADVYASADPSYPQALHAEGLVGKPRVFATNRLVLIVPRANPARIAGLGDLSQPGIKLVLGAEGVPVGDYARRVVPRSALANVVSLEEDVKAIVGKVALGEADAGIVYTTDVVADVRAFELPANVRIPYAVAVVDEDGAEFVRMLFSERGRRALREAGFGLP
jgi:molybdate transport system substrate-binding protein